MFNSSEESPILKLKSDNDVFNKEQLYSQGTLPRRITISQRPLLPQKPLVSEYIVWFRKKLKSFI